MKFVELIRVDELLNLLKEWSMAEILVVCAGIFGFTRKKRVSMRKFKTFMRKTTRLQTN